ncbi:hypothetical protein Cadr_000004491 [Camelus dromedarius]|uniref:Uncharacterized protein n=1 Tax=Camelus dromedarius TaxID=9838 RepID=A0A5N4EBA8_CAMDR|nr:hypothetical protein Cadr_000004491 [Camelus dromedarius]
MLTSGSRNASVNMRQVSTCSGNQVTSSAPVRSGGHDNLVAGAHEIGQNITSSWWAHVLMALQLQTEVWRSSMTLGERLVFTCSKRSRQSLTAGWRKKGGCFGDRTALPSKVGARIFTSRTRGRECSDLIISRAVTLGPVSPRGLQVVFRSNLLNRWVQPAKHDLVSSCLLPLDRQKQVHSSRGGALIHCPGVRERANAPLLWKNLQTPSEESSLPSPASMRRGEELPFSCPELFRPHCSASLTPPRPGQEREAGDAREKNRRGGRVIASAESRSEAHRARRTWQFPRCPPPGQEEQGPLETVHVVSLGPLTPELSPGHSVVQVLAYLPPFPFLILPTGPLSQGPSDLIPTAPSTGQPGPVSTTLKKQVTRPRQRGTDDFPPCSGLMGLRAHGPQASVNCPSWGGKRAGAEPRASKSRSQSGPEHHPRSLPCTVRFSKCGLRTDPPDTRPYRAFLRFLGEQALREADEDPPFSTAGPQHSRERSPWHEPENHRGLQTGGSYLLARFRSLTNSADCWCRISLLLQPELMVEMAPACDVVAEEGGLAGQVQRQEDRGKRLKGTRAAPAPGTCFLLTAKPHPSLQALFQVCQASPEPLWVSRTETSGLGAYLGQGPAHDQSSPSRGSITAVSLCTVTRGTLGSLPRPARPLAGRRQGTASQRMTGAFIFYFSHEGCRGVTSGRTRRCSVLQPCLKGAGAYSPQGLPAGVPCLSRNVHCSWALAATQTSPQIRWHFLLESESGTISYHKVARSLPPSPSAFQLCQPKESPRPLGLERTSWTWQAPREDNAAMKGSPHRPWLGVGSHCWELRTGPRSPLGLRKRDGGEHAASGVRHVFTVLVSGVPLDSDSVGLS